MSKSLEERTVGLRAILWPAVCAISVLLAVVASYVYRHDTYWNQRWMIDFKVYMASGDVVRHGQSLYGMYIDSSLYGHMPYTYPPLASLLFFVGLSAIPLKAASLVWNSCSLIALGAVVWLTLGKAEIHGRAKAVLTVVGLILTAFLMPVRMDLIAGQINLFLLLMVVWDFSGRAGRMQGVGVGLAAGMKITPLLFIVYLVLTRRWAAARNAVLTFLGSIALGFLILPKDAAHYWGGLVIQSSRAGGVFDTPNQSLAGAMARWFSNSDYQTWWLAVFVALACYGLAVAVSAYRRGADFLGFSMVAVTALLVSPISWEHHWVYVIPLLVWLACWAVKNRSVSAGVAVVLLAGIFTVRTFMLVGIPEAPPAPIDLGVWKEIVGAAYPVTGLILLALAPLWTRRHFPAAQKAQVVSGPVNERERGQRTDTRVPAESIR